ncbi:DUF5133 domain-containing protein [Streptomyces sp. NPDC002520]
MERHTTTGARVHAGHTAAPRSARRWDPAPGPDTLTPRRHLADARHRFLPQRAGVTEPDRSGPAREDRDADADARPQNRLRGAARLPACTGLLRDPANPLRRRHLDDTAYTLCVLMGRRDRRTHDGHTFGAHTRFDGIAKAHAVRAWASRHHDALTLTAFAATAGAVTDGATNRVASLQAGSPCESVHSG